MLFQCEPIDLNIKAMACLSGLLYITKKDIIGSLYPKTLYGNRRWDTEWMNNIKLDREEIIEVLPPTVFITSQADSLRKHTINYANSLKSFGKECKLWDYPDNEELTHAFVAIKPYLPESKKAVEKIVRWMKKYE